MRATLSIIVLLLCSLVLAAQQKKVEIKLNSTLQFSISASEIVPFELHIANLTSNSSDLFFVVQYPLNDPAQEPSMTVSTSDGYVKQCYNADDEFSGVCSIPRQQLDSNITVDIQISCKASCQLTIDAFFSPHLRLNLNDTTFFTAPSKHALPIELEVQVPYHLFFTQIAMYAQIINFQNVTQGLLMYANYGGVSEGFPSPDSYDVEGQTTYWGGKGLFFSKQYVAAGDWIKVYLYLSEGMQIKFSSIYMNSNNYYIELNNAYFDFTSASEGKTYILDLSQSNTPTEGKAISIMFIIYSGYPMIDVSLDSNFDKKLSGLNTLGTLNYVLTAQQRLAANASNIIYIHVQSGWNADYYFSTSVQDDSYVSIVPDMSYYSEIQPNRVYNYFFTQIIYSSDENSHLMTYSIRVDSINGKATFGVRRCSTYENGAMLETCLIRSTNELSNQTIMDTFGEIKYTIKNTSYYTSILFQYNLSMCVQFGDESVPNGYYCAFQIIGSNYNKQPIDYIIALNKRRYAALIREGSTIKELIYKDQYLYFKLGMSSLEEITSIAVFVTVIEGDVYLFGSSKEEYPTFETDYTLIKSSSANVLVYQREQLADNIYISVYGLDFSEFTINMIVHREKVGDNSTGNSTNGSRNINSSSSKIGLQLDLTQEFTMQQNDTNATFLIQTSQPLNITVQVVLLAGTVSMQIMDSSNSVIICRDPIKSTTKITCSLTTEAGGSYNVKILGSRGATQKFIILYHKEQNCVPYILNRPLFVQLGESQSGCSVFSIIKLTNFEVTTSVSLLQFLAQSLNFTVCIQDHCLQQVTSHHQIISKSQLSSYCNLGENKIMESSCTIKLSYSTNKQFGMHFRVIVEEQGKDMGLFDGIVQKINKYGLSPSKGLHFYYPIYALLTVKIIFTSLSRSNYYLAAHFQHEIQFFAGNASNYLPYRQVDILSNNPKVNLFEANIDSASKILMITTQSITQFCNGCVLTISVYAKEENAQIPSVFDIQITQQYTRLVTGDSKIGYLGQDEIYNYMLDGGHSGDAFIYLHDLGKESSGEKDCFMAELTDFKNINFRQINNGYTLIKQDEPWANLYITSNSATCNFEVTYTQADYPLLTIAMNRKQTVSLRDGNQSYYLYYHSSNESFRIIQQVQTGSAVIFATPLNNQTIQSLMSANPSTFPFVHIRKSGIFVINSSSQYFCFECNYLIVVKGNPSVNSELLITNLTSNIPLSVNGILRRKIKVNDPLQWYSFNSITLFNITINMKYGSLRVKVMDANNTTISDLNVSTSTVITIPYSKDNEFVIFDVVSTRTLYSISIEAIQDTSYSIKASKKNITRRIFQGIPEYVLCPAGVPIVLEFLNLHPISFNTSGTISVLADVVQNYNNDTLTKLINSSILFESDNGRSSQNVESTSTLQSGETFNWQLPQRLGTYYINFTLSKTVLVLIILAKQSLIHLSPSSNAIMQKQAIFQLFSGKKSTMIQVFKCWGDIGVDSTHNYLDLTKAQNDNEIIMEQNNFGGHYVISAEDINEEYFIRVFSRKQHSELGYLINYHLYNKGDVPPHKLVSLLNSDIRYTLGPTTITFLMNQISVNRALTSSIASADVQYHLYVSSNRVNITKFANCRLEKVYTMTSTIVVNGSVSFQLDIDTIIGIVGGSSTYFVGGEAVVSIVPTEKAGTNYPESLRLIYEVIQLSNVAAPIEGPSSSSIKLIVTWILLPFVIAGILLYFSLNYCIRKYRGLVPNDYVEGGLDESCENKIDNPAEVSPSLKEVNQVEASPSIKEAA